MLRSIPLDILKSEPDDVYHSKSTEYLSSHGLSDFRKCPLLHRKRQLGLIEDQDRPAYLVGRAAHTLILEGRDQYRQRYAVGGPINPSTGKPFGANTKKFAEWASEHGGDVLTDTQALLIENMTAGTWQHDRALEFLNEGKAEGVARTDYQRIPSQIRIDWLNPKRGIVDLKTCDDLTWFEADARRYGYIHQLAFYRAVLAAALNAKLNGDIEPFDIPVHIIAIEKKEPFRCGVWEIGRDVLAIAQQDNEQAIERLKQLRDSSDQWPTGYEATVLVVKRF